MKDARFHLWCSILTHRRHWLEPDRDRGTQQDTICITTPGVYHKYSHIIPHKPPNTSYTPCCQRLGGLSPCLLWQDKSAWLCGELHFCQQTVKIVTWQRSISWTFEEKRRRLRSDSQPLRSHLLSVLTFQSVLYHVRMRFENVPLTLRFCAGENRSECVSCFQGCLRSSKPNTNRPWYFM